MTGSAGSGLVSILTATTLFPNAAQPTHGVFVQTRLCKLLESGNVRAEVLAPVAYAPALIRYGDSDRLRAVPLEEQRNGLSIFHPRYLVIPKLGMNVAPYTLFRAMRRALAQ